MENSTTKISWNLDNSYSRLPQSFFSKINPTFVKAPELVILNYSLASQLGINIEELIKDEGIQILAGNFVPDEFTPIAQAYAGHQFGSFTMLGDGRAILLGEQITPDSERYDIHLKGSGRTPYSRRGDGKATLGPMLREYIISEAMHALGIETTRSLAVVKTGELVYRDTFLKGAILTRVASSHIRVGTFQFASKFLPNDELNILAKYTIKRHYPFIQDNGDKYLIFLKEVIKRQAKLISKWMLVGFIHGVMNTDNMTISGETIDYGPCAFMDTYNTETIFSSIDTFGRYAYGNQPIMAKWNLSKFAETLLPLLHEDKDKAIKMAEDALSEFDTIYKSNWILGMKSKLGIFNHETNDEILINNLLNIMQNNGADYTNTFLDLTFKKRDEISLYSNIEFVKWYDSWKERLNRQEENSEKSLRLMMKSNPAVIPRNHRVEEALEAAVKNDDLSIMEKLLNVLTEPFSHSPDQEEYSKLPPPSFCSYRTFCGT